MNNQVGILTLEATAGALGVPVRTSQLCEVGQIRSITVIAKDAATQFGTLFVEVGIQSSGNGEIYTTALLVTGYVYSGNMLSWVGDMPMTSADSIFVNVFGIAGLNIRANFRIERR